MEPVSLTAAAAIYNTLKASNFSELVPSSWEWDHHHVSISSLGFLVLTHISNTINLVAFSSKDNATSVLALATMLHFICLP